MTKLIANPAGAYGETGIDNNGRVIHERVCSTAVLTGDVVVFDVMTGTDEIVSVHSGLTTDDVNLVAGVATEDAAAGEVCRVVELGPAIVNVTAGAAGDIVGRSGTVAGEAATAASGTFGTLLSAAGVPEAGKAIVYVGNRA